MTRRRRPDEDAELPEHIRSQWSSEELEARANRKRLEVPLADTELGVRTVNTLEEEGILTIAQLVEHKTTDLLAIENFGAKTFREVKRVLGARGIYVRAWGMRPPRSRSKKG